MISPRYSIDAIGQTLRLVALLVFVIASLSCINRGAEVSEKPIVKVNSNSLSTKDFAEDLAYRLKQFDALSVKDHKILKRIKQQILEDFIVEALTQEWAAERGIFVKSEELEAEINQVRSQYPDDLAFRRALNEQGLTFAAWQEKMKFSLLQKKVLSQITAEIPQPTEAEIKNYYNSHKEEFQYPEKVKLRQVVLDSENNAERIFDEIRRGRSIKELATKFSVAPEADRGGEIGWVERGTLEIFDSAFSMRIGQKSEILKSPYGYHIFEILDKRRPGTEPLSVASERIKHLLAEKAEAKAYTSWLEKQIRSATIFKDDKLVDSLSTETEDE
ncbi:MAG: peptidyl-prolyl cis-trans isomerase [Bdellovibrionales bacterium]|nr:peptidyl-prolyl cis-trans isomerase [Bdellovibrionales bacterium]